MHTQCCGVQLRQGLKLHTRVLTWASVLHKSTCRELTTLGGTRVHYWPFPQFTKWIHFSITSLNHNNSENGAITPDKHSNSQRWCQTTVSTLLAINWHSSLDCRLNNCGRMDQQSYKSFNKYPHWKKWQVFLFLAVVYPCHKQHCKKIFWRMNAFL